MVDSSLPQTLPDVGAPAVASFRPDVGGNRRTRNRSAACRADALVRPCRTTCQVAPWLLLYVAICQLLPHLSSTMHRRSPYGVSIGASITRAPQATAFRKTA